MKKVSIDFIEKIFTCTIKNFWSSFFTSSREKLHLNIKVKGPTCAGPLILTNPLNSSTKLQFETTLQNNFLAVCITFNTSHPLVSCNCLEFNKSS